MRIKKLEMSDINQLCTIHSATFNKSHFSSLFPPNMLNDYYGLLLGYNEFCLGVTDDADDKLCGYLICGQGYNESISGLTREYKKEIISLILRNPRFLSEKILDYYFDFIKKEKEKIIIVIITAIKPEKKGKGYANFLHTNLETMLLERGVKKYGSYVRKSNSQSIRSKQKLGFQLKGENYKSYFFLKYLKQTKSE